MRKNSFLLAHEHLRSVDEQLALARRSFAPGAATVVDMDEARAASDSAHADLVKAHGEVARLRRAAEDSRTSRRCGRRSKQTPRCQSFADSPSDTWEADAQTLGLAVRQQQIALEVSKVNAGYMPSVSIVGNASDGNAAFINGQTNFYTGAHRASSGEIGIQIGFRAGVRINADVLDAEDKLFRTRRDLARARYDALMPLLHPKTSVARWTTSCDSCRNRRRRRARRLRW